MKKVLSVLLAIMLLVQLCGFAIAETYTVTYTDPDGKTQTLTFDGTLYATENGKYVFTGATLDTTCGEYINEGIFASSQEDGQVTVEIAGDLIADFDGIFSLGQSTVLVGGDITADYTGIHAVEKSSVHVVGNVTSGHSEEYSYEDEDA